MNRIYFLLDFTFIAPLSCVMDENENIYIVDDSRVVKASFFGPNATTIAGSSSISNYFNYSIDVFFN